jgi:hypothetical protein
LQVTRRACLLWWKRQPTSNPAQRRRNLHRARICATRWGCCHRTRLKTGFRALLRSNQTSSFEMPHLSIFSIKKKKTMNWITDEKALRLLTSSRIWTNQPNQEPSPQQEHEEPNDQDESIRCCDNSFCRRCHAGVRSRHERDRTGKPIRFGVTARNIQSVGSSLLCTSSDERGAPEHRGFWFQWTRPIESGRRRRMASPRGLMS